MSLEHGIHRIADALFAVRDELAKWRSKAFPETIPAPGQFQVTLISERRVNDMDLLTYEATLPTVPPNTDVSSQTLTVTVDGTARPAQSLDKAATSATFEVPQDSNVLCELRYVDDAGNFSGPQSQSFVAKDTIAPDAPGAFGEIKLTGERTE